MALNVIYLMIGAFFIWSANGLDHCSQGNIVRKDFETLSQEEIDVFVSTIKIAMDTPHPKYRGLSLWEGGAQTHFDLSRSIHGNPNFLYWHRLFLLDMELELKKINKEFQFPYLNSGARFRDWQNTHAIRVTNEQFNLNRQIDWNSVTHGEFMWTEALFRSKFDAASKGFYQWAVDAEFYHGSIHNLIRGDMFTHFSPRDPAFYLHHAYIDMQWAIAQQEWEKLSLDQFRGAFPSTDGGVRFSSRSSPVPGYHGFTFESVVKIASLCYSYDIFTTEIETTTTTETSATQQTTMEQETEEVTTDIIPSVTKEETIRSEVTEESSSSDGSMTTDINTTTSVETLTTDVVISTTGGETMTSDIVTTESVETLTTDSIITTSEETRTTDIESTTSVETLTTDVVISTTGGETMTSDIVTTESVETLTTDSIITTSEETRTTDIISRVTEVCFTSEAVTSVIEDITYDYKKISTRPSKPKVYARMNVAYLDSKVSILGEYATFLISCDTGNEKERIPVSNNTNDILDKIPCPPPLSKEFMEMNSMTEIQNTCPKVKEKMKSNGLAPFPKIDAPILDAGDISISGAVFFGNVLHLRQLFFNLAIAFILNFDIAQLHWLAVFQFRDAVKVKHSNN